jgi:hypothetical protein
VLGVRRRGLEREATDVGERFGHLCLDALVVVHDALELDLGRALPVGAHAGEPAAQLSGARRDGVGEPVDVAGCRGDAFGVNDGTGHVSTPRSVADPVVAAFVRG